jgi:type IV secretion system protein VirB9
MMKKLTCLSLLLLCSFDAYAISTPKGSVYDNRVQTIAYNPEDVFRINSKIGVSTLIQLESDEKLEGNAGLGIGDAQAWSLAVRGNNIFLKPTAKQADTNMVLVTNKRTYAFLLTTQKKDSKYHDSYIVKFSYPDTELAKLKAQEKQRNKVKELAQQYNLSNTKTLNYDYWGYGDLDLMPSAAWDDGQFTYFEYNTRGELPTVFKVTDNGEAIVNSHMQGNLLVLHDTSSYFVVRLGNKVLGVDNNSYTTQDNSVRTGTSMTDTVRVMKEKP